MITTVMQRISQHAKDGAALRTAFFEEQVVLMYDCAFTMALAVAQGHKLLFCGNGGSAADVQHLVGEFVNRFLMDRPPLPALALSANTANITAIANDFGYEYVFSRQIQALGQAGDVLVALSTSGTSPNVLAALTAARQKGLLTIGLTGEGGTMLPLCDKCLCVHHKSTPLIQEVHLAAGHVLCQLVDYFLFEDVSAISAQLQKKPVQDENHAYL